MASSDDFKEALQAGNLAEALAVAMGKAIDLQITTSVVEAQTNFDSTPTAQDQRGYRLRTHINLVQGDIDNEIGEEFLSGGRYSQLRRFHQQQVAQGNHIIDKNLKTIRKLLGIWLKIQQKNPRLKDSRVKSLDANIFMLSEEELEYQTQQLNTIETDSSAPETPSTPAQTSMPAQESHRGVDEWDDAISELFEPFQVPSKTNSPAQTDLSATFTFPATIAPEMPVSDLEVEDWETQTPNPTPTETQDAQQEVQQLLSLADLELEEEEEEQEFLAEELQPEEFSALHDDTIAPPEGLFVEGSEEGKALITEELQPEAVSTTAEHDWGDLLDEEPQRQVPLPSLNYGGEDEDEDGDWGDLLDEEPTTDVKIVPGAPQISPIDNLDWEDNTDWVEVERYKSYPGQTPATNPDTIRDAPVADDDFGFLFEEGEKKTRTTASSQLPPEDSVNPSQQREEDELTAFIEDEELFGNLNLPREKHIPPDEPQQNLK